MSYLRDQLVVDKRFRMPMSEYNQLLQVNEVDPADGLEFLKGLHTAGLVLYYPQRAPDWIYLKPRAITRELLHMLDPDGSVSAALVTNKATNLAKMEEEYARLTVIKDKMDNQAMSKGQRLTYGIMAGITIQGFVMARLIWWDLSWDVMEPVAYLMAFTYMTFGWAYFLIARDDIAEYGNLAGKYIAGLKRKLYAKNNFNLSEYDELNLQILQQKKTLKAFGVVPAAERKDYPIPHGVLRAELQHKSTHKSTIEDKV